MYCLRVGREWHFILLILLFCELACFVAYIVATHKLHTPVVTCKSLLMKHALVQNGEIYKRTEKQHTQQHLNTQQKATHLSKSLTFGTSHKAEDCPEKKQTHTQKGTSSHSLSQLLLAHSLCYQWIIVFCAWWVHRHPPLRSRSCSHATTLCPLAMPIDECVWVY